jgi:hypothetical protein
MSFSIKSTHVFVDIAQAIPEPEQSYIPNYLSTSTTAGSREPARQYPSMGPVNTAGSAGGMAIRNNPTSMEDAF